MTDSAGLHQILEAGRHDRGRNGRKEPRERVPGLVAAVLCDDRITTATAGVLDVRTGMPVHADTPLLWFSMTKLVTATTVVRLAERGLVDLDEPVAARFPDLLPARPAGAAAVTARHLLTHTAGLPNPPPVRWVHPAAVAGPDPDRFLRDRMRRVRRLRSAPGTRAAYSNLGYLALGGLVAAVTGRPFVDVVHDEVLTPLGMHATGFTWPAAGDGPTPATGHQRLPRALDPALALALPRGIVGPRSGPWRTLHPFLVDGAAYGGLVGPVTDAARFLRMHANGGEIDGARYLPTAAVRAMQTVTATGRPYDHGLGWTRPAGTGHGSFVQHLGGGGGFHTLMRLHPATGIGAVVMGNSTSYAAEALVDALLAAPISSSPSDSAASNPRSAACASP